MTIITEVGAAKVADLMKEVQAGNEVLLMDAGKLVAKVVAMPKVEGKSSNNTLENLRLRSFKGIKVLTPIISQAEIAEDMYDR